MRKVIESGYLETAGEKAVKMGHTAQKADMVALVKDSAIPKSVTAIGKNAFARCRKLQAVELSRRTKVDEKAFADSPRVDLRCRD